MARVFDRAVPYRIITRRAKFDAATGKESAERRGIGFVSGYEGTDRVVVELLNARGDGLLSERVVDRTRVKEPVDLADDDVSPEAWRELEAIAKRRGAS